MTAILLTALFSISALFAFSAIAATWRRYGQSALALRSQLAACGEWREVTVRIDEITVRATATVLRPDFKRRLPRPAVLPAAA